MGHHASAVLNTEDILYRTFKSMSHGPSGLQTWKTVTKVQSAQGKITPQ